MRSKLALEQNLQGQLQDTGLVHKIGPENPRRKVARSEPSHLICTRTVVARARTGVAGDRSPLDMVKHIERFRTELNRRSFLNGNVFKQRHIKVDSIRIAQAVPSRVSEGQAARLRVRSGVVIQWPESLQAASSAEARFGVTDLVGICGRTKPIPHARIVCVEYHAKRRTRAEGCDT